ncbi:hypothetical protein [Natrinema sp. 74]|uniref:hypothetical protein n=1 Tax=Natrinema sp. 74 TaxID=3384159 RepID=UPI0038D3877B
MPLTEYAPPAFVIGFFMIYLSTILLSFYWVFLDAKKQGKQWTKALLWGIVVGLFLPMGLLYLYLRKDSGYTPSPILRTEQLIKVFIIGGVIALCVGGIIAPPDPLTQVRYTVIAFPLCLVIGYLIIQRKKILSSL